MSKRQSAIRLGGPQVHADLHFHRLYGCQLGIAKFHVADAHRAVLQARQLAQCLGNGGLYFHST